MRNTALLAATVVGCAILSGSVVLAADDLYKQDAIMVRVDLGEVGVDIKGVRWVSVVDPELIHDIKDKTHNHISSGIGDSCVITHRITENLAEWEVVLATHKLCLTR